MAKIYPKMFFDGAIVEDKAAALSITSSAVLYGLSVYTVFPAFSDKDGNLAAFRLAEHLKRLKNSAKIMGLGNLVESWNTEDLTLAVKKLVNANAIEEDIFVRASLHVDERLPGMRSRGLNTNFS